MAGRRRGRRGHRNQEVAKLLSISVRAAETHRAQIRWKLQARAELVRCALAQGLLAASPVQVETALVALHVLAAAVWVGGTVALVFVGRAFDADEMRGIIAKTG